MRRERRGLPSQTDSSWLRLGSTLDHTVTMRPAVTAQRRFEIEFFIVSCLVFMMFDDSSTSH